MAGNKKKRKLHRVGFALVVIVAVLVLLGCSAMIFLGFIDSPFGSGTDNDSGQTDTQGNSIIDNYKPAFANDLIDKTKREGQYTFLVAGVDRGSKLTDVLMLVKFDMTAGKVNILQIPRDTHINTDNYSKKINAVNAYGGIGSLRETIAEAFGVEADRYILMDLNGFAEIVDILGGVDIDVPMDMKYKDPYQNPPLVIDLKKGPQTLNGKQAEQFVRFRKGYATGDLGRVEMQKLFLKAFSEKFFSAATIFKLPSLTSSLMENIKTDITLKEMLYFAKGAVKLDTSDMTVFTVPGESFTFNHTSYFGAYEDETLSIINGYFNPYTEEIDDLEIYEFNRKRSESETGSGGTVLSELGKEEDGTETSSSSQHTLNNSNNKKS